MKTILVDVDQVVADLHEEWLSRYNKTYQDDLTLERITGWAMHDFVKPECGHRIYNYLRMPNLYSRVRPIEGAQKGVASLLARKHRVVFVSSCVIGSMDMKARWLQKHGFLDQNSRSHSDLILAKDKSLVRGDVLIDDGPHNVQNFPGPTILVDYPYNRDLPVDRRAKNWPEILRHVDDIFTS